MAHNICTVREDRGELLSKSARLWASPTGLNKVFMLTRTPRVRLGMYAGMGLLLATIWVHLGTSDAKINDRFVITVFPSSWSSLSVHFFSVAFLAFMVI